MANLKQELNIILNSYAIEVKDSLSDQKFLDGLQDLIVELIIKRTQAGYDIYSRKFGGYNRSYKKKKAYAYAKKHGGIISKYASTSTSDKLQLTGHLFNAIKAKKVRVTQIKNTVILKTGSYILGTKQQKKAEGLGNTTGHSRGGGRYSKKAWLFLGLAIRGAWAKSEQKAINNYIEKWIGEKLVQKINSKNR